MVAYMGRHWGGLCLLLVLCVDSTAATCATFAAWLSPDKQVGHTVMSAKLTQGFAAFTVAPDMESIEVNWQVTADQAASFANPNYITSVGVYGPATVDQVKPANRGVLLDMQTLEVSPGATSAVRLRLASAELGTVLQLMREGHAYVNVATTGNLQGELRGQIVVPHCLEAELMGPASSRGFANVLLSGEMELAALTQVAPDASMFAGEISFSGLPAIGAGVSMEWSPLAPSRGQHYEVQLSVVAAHWEALMGAMRGEAEVTVTASRGAEAVAGVLGGAKGCRRLMTAEDSLFSIARAHRSDWLTLWSMNLGQPDRRLTLEPKYFAHPMEVSLGESGAGIAGRFGMTLKELQMVNPQVMDLASLSVGSTICVLPNWQQTVSGNGRRICDA